MPISRSVKVLPWFVGVVADFAASPLLRELFRRMPLKDMLLSIEANAVKVRLAALKKHPLTLVQPGCIFDSFFCANRDAVVGYRQ